MVRGFDRYSRPGIATPRCYRMVGILSIRFQANPNQLGVPELHSGRSAARMMAPSGQVFVALMKVVLGSYRDLQLRER
jgi:hypothetical protein